MTQQVADQRRTRDQFFNKKEEEQAQATFGITPLSDRSLSRNIDSDDDEMSGYPVIGSIQQETDPLGHSQYLHPSAQEEKEDEYHQESPEKMLASERDEDHHSNR